MSRAVPNIKSDRPAETRDFFLDLLGFEVAMDLGWVVTVGSPSTPGPRSGGDRVREPSGTIVNIVSHRSG